MWCLCGLGSELAHCHVHLVIVAKVSHVKVWEDVLYLLERNSAVQKLREE